jgi:hypothetical protein
MRHKGIPQKFVALYFIIHIMTWHKVNCASIYLYLKNKNKYYAALLLYNNIIYKIFYKLNKKIKINLKSNK